MLNGAHGGNDLALDIELDLSANINPMGMPEGVRRAVLSSTQSWESYPDPHCSELRERIAEMLNVPVENIVCGNGADDLIYRIAWALRPKKALICAPTFGEYGKALRESGCTVREHILSPEKDFDVTESFADSIAGCDMAILCSPNNPTGRIIAPEVLERIGAECRKTGAYLLCDESFIGFAEKASERSALNFMNENVIVLRSFTKLFAMAGLRIGYAVCGSSETASRIAGTGQYWSVSAPAQAAGIAALDEVDYIRETSALIKIEREYLTSELERLGLRVFPSEANYVLFRAHEELGERLLSEGILLRSCANYTGLDRSYFRAAVRSRDENRRFLAAVGRILNG